MSLLLARRPAGDFRVLGFLPFLALNKYGRNLNPVPRASHQETARRRNFAIISHPDAAARRRSPRSSCSTAAPCTGRLRHRPQEPARHHLRLDGTGTQARHLRQLHRPAVRIRRLRDQSARHPRSQGLLRRHLPRPHRRRCRHHGHRCRQGHRSPDPQALRSLPPPRRAHLHVHEQDGPPRREPMELLDELENVLGIGAFPINWPLGTGPASAASATAGRELAHLRAHRRRGLPRARSSAASTTRWFAKARTQPPIATVLRRTGDARRRRRGIRPRRRPRRQTTPVFFGSAPTTSGCSCCSMASSNTPRRRPRAKPGRPDRARIRLHRLHLQDPGQHGPAPPRPHRLRPHRVGQIRARHAVTHAQTARRAPLELRQLFGQDRETLDEAYAGDVIGIVGNAKFCHRRHALAKTRIVFDEIPRFPPESSPTCKAPLRRLQTLPRRPDPAPPGRRRAGFDLPDQRGRRRCWGRSARCSSRSSSTGPKRGGRRVGHRKGGRRGPWCAGWDPSVDVDDITIYDVLFPATDDEVLHVLLFRQATEPGTVLFGAHPDARLSDKPFLPQRCK